MNYFDWQPFLPRRIQRAVAGAVIAGLLFLPGPTSRLVDSQIQLRATEIANSLDSITKQVVANMMHSERAQITRRSRRTS